MKRVTITYTRQSLDTPWYWQVTPPSVLSPMDEFIDENSSRMETYAYNTGDTMIVTFIFNDEQIEEVVQTKQTAPTKQYSKNPMINQILNETAMAPATGDGGFRTMNFGQGDMGSIVGKTALAEKMGYGEMTKGPQPTGLGVNTGVAEIDKALNRDYSELVKRFKKK
mgnify:CR=1 FL=1